MAGRRSCTAARPSTTRRLPRGQTTITGGSFARATKPGVSPAIAGKEKEAKEDLQLLLPSKKKRKLDNHGSAEKEEEPQHGHYLNDFLHLHSSFLKTLALQFAHNNGGGLIPADVGQMLGSIERIWKKRKVSIKDLRRIVWVWDLEKNKGSSSSSLFRIVNYYGLGEMCLEIQLDGQGRRKNGLGIDEDGLQRRFERILDDCRYQEEESLGLAPVHQCLATPPLLSLRRGQQRLQDLRNGVIKVKMDAHKNLDDDDDDDKADAQTNKTQSDNAGTTAMDRRKHLFERIKNKQLHQSTLLPPPSKETLLRRAAAERAEDVARILASLRPITTDSIMTPTAAAGPMQRKSYRIDTIVEHVQNSMRTPVSRQEIEACLDVLADVAGEWISIIVVKEVRNVVLKSFAHVSSRDIGERVRQLRIGYD